jgi:hypothetical protein
LSLLANPSRLDGSRQRAQVDVRRQVGEPCVTTSAEA